MRVLEGLTAPFCRMPLRVDSICLFEQPERGRPFVVAARYPFAAG